MKFIYLVQYRQLNGATQRFELYRTEAYSSKVKAFDNVNNSMEVNKAYNIEEQVTVLDEVLRNVDYYTRENCDRVECKLRMIIEKVELR